MPAQRHYVMRHVPALTWAATRFTGQAEPGLWIAEGSVGEVWFNLNVVRARGGFVALLTVTREGRDLVSANSTHDTMAAARLWLKMALADLL